MRKNNSAIISGKIKILSLAALLCVCAMDAALCREILVFVNMRGKTGLEGRVKNIVSREFSAHDNVSVTEDREKCHLYLDLTLIELEAIRFYSLGVSIAYHIREKFYSRPTSDVAQFGEERMEDICVYLVGEIDKAFVEPLRKPPAE